MNNFAHPLRPKPSSNLTIARRLWTRASGIPIRKFLAFLSSGLLATSLLSAGVAPTLASGNCNQTVTGTLVYEASQVGSDCVVRFISGSGTWTPRADISTLTQVLVVGGGGSGGQANGDVPGNHNGGSGGGGAGGLRGATNRPISGNVDVTVGSGGMAVFVRAALGSKGSASAFGELQAGGGGGGGGFGGGSTCPASTSRNPVMNGDAPLGRGGGAANSGPYKCGGFYNGEIKGDSDGRVGTTTAGGKGGSSGIGNANKPGRGSGVPSDITGLTVTYSVGGNGGVIRSMVAPTRNSSPGGGGSGSGAFTADLGAHDGNDGVVIVRYTLPFFEVTFDSQDGSNVVTQQTLSVASSPGVSRTDFEFQGWFDSASGGTEISFPYSPNANVTLYAQWLPLREVTFDAQDGSTPTVQNVTSVLTSPSTTRSNFEFQGWFDSATGGSQIAFEYQPSADVTLYAQWLPIYTVTFDSQGGSNIDALVVSSISAQPATSKATFQLAGFFDSPSGGSEIQFPFMPVEDTTLYAQWIPLYVVTFDSQEGTSVDPDETEVVVSSPGVSRTDFEFQGWFDSASGGTEISFPYSPNANVTLYAQWLPLREVTFDAQDGSTPTVQNVTSVLTSPSTTRSNFEFQGWFDAATGGNEISFAYQPPSDITLYAQWLPIYTVTFNSHRGSSIEAQSTTGNISSPTPTRYAYQFNGWFTSRNGGEQITFPYTPTSNLILHAQWTHGARAGMNQSRLPSPTQIAIDGTSRKTYNKEIRSGVSSRIEIPAGALPANTTVEVYTITDTDFVSSAISNSYRFLVTQIISWTDSNGDVAIATEPIVMTVTDPSVVAGSRIYSIMNEVVTQIGVATQDGEAVITFTEDPLITVAITSPDAPTSLTVNSAAQTSVNLSWLAPAVNGGDAITSYVVTSNTGENCTTATLTCAITGLNAGTTYSFSVQAINSIGTSPVSSSVTFGTPGVIPTTPGLPVVSEPSLLYSGPIIDSTQRVHQGSEVVFTGRRLDSVTAARIGAVQVSISSVSSQSLRLTVGSSVSVGTYDLVLESSLGTVTFQNGVIVLAGFNAANSTIIEVEARAKKLTVGASRGFIAIYTKGYEGRKLSAKVAGKWLVVNSIDESLEGRGHSRTVRRTGVGRAIKIHLYIDGVFQRTEELTTK